FNTRTSCGQVGDRVAQVSDRGLEAVLNRTEVAAEVIDLLQSVVNSLEWVRRGGRTHFGRMGHGRRVGSISKIRAGGDGNLEVFALEGDHALGVTVSIRVKLDRRVSYCFWGATSCCSDVCSECSKMNLSLVRIVRLNNSRCKHAVTNLNSKGILV